MRTLLTRPALTALLAAAGTGLLAQSATDIIADQSRTAFTIQGAGARAVGTGGAFIAVADDATAVSYNPAGLAQLLRPEISLTGAYHSRNMTMTGFSNKNPDTPDTWDNSGSKDQGTKPNFLSVAIPWKRDGLNTTLQFSYQRLLDFDLADNRGFNATPNGGGASQAISQNIEQEGGIDLYSVALGAELSQRILVGASINVWRGSWDFSSTSSTSANGTQQFDSIMAQGNQFRGLNANLGLIWRSDLVNVGVVYRTPFTATYTFDNSRVTLDASTGLPVGSTGARQPYDVKWPETLGWGLGIHPVSRLLLTADWSRTPWSNTVFKPSGTAYDNMNFFDMAVKSKTRNCTDFHTGGEWVAFLGDSVVIPIRAGYFKEPQPMVDSNTGTQQIFYGWTAGFGIKFSSFTVDAAFKDSRSSRYISQLNDSAPSGGVEAYAYGTQNITEKQVFLSLIYQLETDVMHKALGWLLVGN